MRSAIIGLFCAAAAVGIAGRAAATGTAEGGGVIQTLVSGIPHAALFGISFDAGTGVAVGVGGSILTSTDGGLTWTPVKQTATDMALLAVERRGAHTIAVGQLGTALIEDASGSWKKVDTGIEGRLLSVSVNSSGLAVAGGEFGTLLRSTDGGETWSSLAPEWKNYADADVPGTAEPQVYSVHVDEPGNITIAGEFGMIMRLEKGSDKWRVLSPIAAGKPTIFATCFTDTTPSIGYAVGQSGEVQISPDGGKTWVRNPVDTKANFLGVTVASGRRVVITGMRVMMRSDDGGAAWIPVEEGDTTTEWYQAVKTDAKSGRIIAVGHAGRIIQIKG